MVDDGLMINDDETAKLEKEMALKGGLENIIRDNNEEILNQLIMKKV